MVKSADLEPRATPEIEAGAAVLLRPVLQAYASGRQGFHEVLANRGFHAVVLEGDRGGQIWLEDPFHLRIHFALIALCIPLLGPESDGDHLFGLGLREQGQDFQKSRLLFQDRQYFVAHNFHKLFFLFEFRNKFNNAGKHDGSPFLLENIGATRKLTHLGADYESTSLNNVRIGDNESEFSDST